MSSNNPSNTTDTHERLPSHVPNDMDRLNVPSDVNITLNGTRASRARRRQARRRRSGMPNWFKALLALMGIMLALGVVAIVIFLIMFPPYFRDHIEPRYQQRIIEMFPPATHWMATRPFEQLPTLSGGGDGNAAQQLLLTQESTLGEGAVTQPPGGISTGDDGAGTVVTTPTAPVVTPTPTGETIEGIPVGALPSPTDLPSWSSPTPQAQALEPTWTPNFVPTEQPLPAQVRLSQPLRYELQGWNNCGPTTMTMALSHFGWQDDQYTAANWMKPNIEDKNVSPWQMVRFVNDVAYSSTGAKALYRYGGTISVLKRLLAAGFPVVIEESIQPEKEGWMGHYVLLMGYDDFAGEFLSYDSYLGYDQGNGRAQPYVAFDDKWRQFNRIFMVLYRPTDEAALRAALGPYVDKTYGYQVALEAARAEAEMFREDKWAWFNMGTSYTLLGDYNNAAIAFDLAFQLGLPFRMLWYQFGPYEAYYYAGRYEDVHFYASATVATTPDIEESYYWMGMAYAAKGQLDSAVEQFNLALTYNRNFFDAQAAKEAVQTGTFTVAAKP